MIKKKQDLFKENNLKIDWKDTDTLAKFINPHSRILNRRKTSLEAKNQRFVANAIKRARFMGLLPYVAR